MAKIDLKRTSGFPLIYDGEDLQAKDLSFKDIISVSIDDIRSQLLNKELTCPEVFYKKYKFLDFEGLYASKNLQINFFVLKPNLAGIEFVKTRATRCSQYARIIDIVYGGATILLQRYRSPKDNRIIRIIAKKEQKVIIPAGFSAVVINTRQNSNLIFAEYCSLKAKPEVVLDDKNGLAYYIIRKNAKQETVRNPFYKIVNEPEKLDWDKIILNYGITPKTPVIKQILRKYEKLDWLFKENSVTV
jgi:hypothetical protein